MKALKPLGKWILINLVSSEQSVGGLIMPEVSKEKTSELLVEAVGPDVKKVAVGDEVVFIMQQAIKVDLPDVGKGRVLILEDNILGILQR